MLTKNLLFILFFFFVIYSSTYYVTKDSSFLTKPHYYPSIKTGISKLKSGDTLVIKGGVYTEGELIIGVSGTENKPVVIRGEDGTIIKGSKTLNTVWVSQATNVWKTTYTESIQSERIFLTDSNFITIIPLKMVASLELLNGDSMSYYDMKNKTLYVSIKTNPNKYNTEVPVYKGLLLINCLNIHLKNMNLLFTDSLGWGLAINSVGYNVVVDSLTIKYMNWGGVYFQGTSNVLKNSNVSYCGCFGVTGKGNSHLIYNNSFSYNNTDLYDVDCVSAGVKFGLISKSIIMKNTFSNNYAPGLWLDVESDSNLIIQNTSYNNCIAGIQIEISKSNVLVNNIAYKNKVPVHGNYKVPNDKLDKYKGFQTINNYYHDYWNRSGNGIWVPTSPYTKLFNNVCNNNQGAGLRIDGGIRKTEHDSLTTRDIICQKNISINNQGTQLWLKEDAVNIKSDYNIFSAGDTIFRTNLSAKSGGRFTTLSEWQASMQQDLHSVVYNEIDITDSTKGTIIIKDNNSGLPLGDTIDLMWAYGTQSASLKLGPKAGPYGVSGSIKTLIGTIRLESDDNGVFIDSTINPTSPCIYSVMVDGISPLQSGTMHLITWSVDSTVKIDSCVISVSFDSGATWKSIGKTVGTTSLFDWSIPKRKSDSAFIKISAYDYKKNSFTATSGKFSTTIISEFVLNLQLYSQRCIVASWNPASITNAKKEAFCLAYKKGNIVTSIDEKGIDTIMYDLKASCDTISKGFGDEVATFYFTAFIRDTDKKFTVANGAAVSSIVIGEPPVPDNPCILGGNSIDSNKIVLTWKVNDSKGALFDSVAVWYNEFGYPGKAYDSRSVKAGTWGLNTLFNTITGLKIDKLYYFSIFAMDTSGIWSRTSDSSKAQIRTGKSIGTTKGYPVIFQGSEVESLFTDTLTIRGENFSKPHTDTIDRWDIPFSNGFIICGPPFAFRNGNLPADTRLHFGIRYHLPDARLSRNDIRVYRFNINTMAWRLDNVRITYETTGDKLFFSTSAPELPFSFMIDTLAPDISVYTHDTATCSFTEPLCDTLTIHDNIENPRITLLAGPGAKSYTDFSYFIVPAGTGLYTTTIPAYVADPASGLRSILIISDGRSIDTVNLSRKILRTGSNCDDKIVPAMEWTPISTTAHPIKNSLDAVFSKALGTNTFNYDNREQRILRWLPVETNVATMMDKWFEYTHGAADDFSFSRGKTIWIKSRNMVAVRFDTAIIPALIDTFEIHLKKGEWSDFSLPYNFDIYAGDIIEATRRKNTMTDGIELYEWVKSGKTYITKALYLSGIDDVADPGAILKAGGSYIAFNDGNHDISLRIPPVCVPMSGRKCQTVKKSAPSTQWSIKLGFRDASGMELSPVYCLALPESKKLRYYQAAPTFSTLTAGVMDRENGKRFAHVASGDLSAGGTSFIIYCENRSDKLSHLTITTDKITNLPAEIKAVMYFDKSQTDTSSMASCNIALSPGQQCIGYLIVGSANYISDFINDLRSVFSFLPFTANRSLRIRYTLPVDVTKMTTSIFDLMGRCLDRIVMTSELHAGGSLLTFDRRFTCGYYIVQMKIETLGRENPLVLNRRWMFVR